MLIIDDLFMILLENMTEYANRQYIENLEDYLKSITLMNERGQLDRKTFEEQRAQVLRAIEACTHHLERRGKRRPIEVGL